jgi:DNA-binding LacI/PurR family transcriptional regulator
VRQPVVEVAQLATNLLLDRLQGREESGSDHRLRAEIVYRASTGKAASTGGAGGGHTAR